MGETENGTGGSMDDRAESPKRGKPLQDDKREVLERRRRDSSHDPGKNDGPSNMEKSEESHNTGSSELLKVEEPKSKRNDFNDESKHDDSRDRSKRKKRDVSQNYSSRSPERRRDRSRSRGSDRKRKRVDESRERRADSEHRDRSRDRDRRRESSRDRRRRHSSRDRSSRRRSRSRYRRSRSRSRGSTSRHAKLFIGNISFNTDVQTLNRIFSKYGRLADVYIPRPNSRDEIWGPRNGRPSPKSKGFAFVTYDHPDDAAAAMRDWDNRELDGRVIAVEYSKPRRPQPRYRSRSRYSRSRSRGNRRGGYSRSRSRRRY